MEIEVSQNQQREFPSPSDDDLTDMEDGELEESSQNNNMTMQGSIQRPNGFECRSSAARSLGAMPS